MLKMCLANSVLGLTIAYALSACVVEPRNKQWYEGGTNIRIPFRTYLPWENTQVNSQAFNFTTGRWVKLNDDAISHSGTGFIANDGTGVSWFPAGQPRINAVGNFDLPADFWRAPPTEEIPLFARGYPHGFRRAKIRFFTGEPGNGNSFDFVHSMATYENSAEVDNCVVSTFGAQLGGWEVVRRCARAAQPAQPAHEVHLWTCATSPCPRPDGWHVPGG